MQNKFYEGDGKVISVRTLVDIAIKRVQEMRFNRAIKNFIPPEEKIKKNKPKKQTFIRPDTNKHIGFFGG